MTDKPTKPHKTSQVNMRMSDGTRRKLEALVAHTNANKSEIIAVAIDRMYMQELGKGEQSVRTTS